MSTERNVSLHKRVMTFFQRFRIPEPQTFSNLSLLPQDVINTIQYGTTEVGPREITRLIHEDFPDIAVYLLMKELAQQPEIQQQFLEDLTDLALIHTDRKMLKPFLLQTAASIPANQKVIGTKLLQLNRVGPDLFTERFTTIATTLHNSEPATSPVFMGAGSMLGYSAFVDVYKTSSTPLYILLPKWLQDNKNQLAGYSITLDNTPGSRVTFLPKTFTRPNNVAFIDDTLRSGEQAQAMWNFWHQHEIPLDPTRFKVVVRVPKMSNV